MRTKTLERENKHSIPFKVKEKRGENIYFPDVDEVLGLEVFIHGFDVSCE